MKKITRNKLALRTNTIAVLTLSQLGAAVGGAVPSTRMIGCDTQFEPNRPFGVIVND